MWFHQGMRSTQRDAPGEGVPAARPAPPDSVLGRAALLLAAFDDRSPRLGVSELARRTGLAKSTVHRLAREMEAYRLLVREGTDYRLGEWLFELGELVPTRRTLAEAAQPLMEDLREATQQRVHLAVREGTNVVYVSIMGGTALGLLSRVGGRLPAHATGVGKVMLAYSSRAVVQAQIEAGLPQLTPRTISTASELQLELRRIRSIGMALEAGESHDGVACVAAPVFGANRRIIAGLSLTGLADKIDPVTLGPAVRTAAFVLSRTLREQGI